MNNLTLILIGLLLFVGSLGAATYLKLQLVKDQLKIASNNEKALLRSDIQWRDANGRLNNKNIQLQLTTKELASSNDSLLSKLSGELKTRKDRKGVQNIGIITTTADVTFKSLISNPVIPHYYYYSSLKDTTMTLGDEWVKNIVTLTDSSVSVRNIIKDELYVKSTAKRETVADPKKFFIARWLQARHTIIEVTVRSQNPHVKQLKSRFVNIQPD